MDRIVYDRMAAHDSTHWWYRARRDILADYITRNIKNPVSRVPGVGQFQLFAAPRAMRVWVDPAKLVGFNLSMSQVNQAIAEFNRILSYPPAHIGLQFESELV